MKALLVATLLTMNAYGFNTGGIQGVTPETRALLTQIYSKEKTDPKERFAFAVGVIRPTKDVLVFVADLGSGLYVFRIDVFFCSEGNWNRKKRIAFSTNDKKKCPASASVLGNIVIIIDGYGKMIDRVDVSKEEKKSDRSQGKFTELQK